MKLEQSGLTDTGRTRKNNEDAILADAALRLFVVADGMGGASAGEVASATAIAAVQRGVAARLAELDAADARGDSWHAQALLEQALQEACAEVHRTASESAELKGMGTTVTAAWFSPRRVIVAHVGDSRLYLVRGGECHPLTEDHSLVKELLRQGRITEGEVATFPYPNALTRALGPQPRVEVDTLDVELVSGDRFLVCSDGLHRYLADAQVAAALGKGTVDEVARILVGRANEAGGADNISAVVIEVSDVTPGEGDAQRKVDIFRGMPLFRYLAYKELSQVIAATTMRHYAAGQTIFDENTAGYELYVIYEGRVQLRKGGATLAELAAGGHFGEMALVDQDRRSATAVALEPVRLLVLSRKKFYQVLRKDPPLAVKLLWNFLQVLSGRLRQANESISEHFRPPLDAEELTQTQTHPQARSAQEP